MIFSLLASLAAIGSGVHVHGDGLPPYFQISGQTQVGSSSGQLATLNVSCDLLPALTMRVELRERDLRSATGDHGRADSRAAKADVRVRLTWSSASTHSDAEISASGEPVSGAPREVLLPAPDETVYAFVSTIAVSTNGPAALFQTIATEPGTLSWTLAAEDNGSVPLTARFELDARAATALHEAASGCASAAAATPPEDTINT